ncbi:PAS domain S-box-containing protein [Dethiosulfatibacter aminovorans DSM 17477]|uniref:HTH-type transcriptional regulatory protein TyrR n=1 Tax=Dethiosulfatibacter aminovorans DSM 17477 TaxID=1121476 RepID=A0A1M6MP44_9FIRM|nr:sigma 54-interacting transcriptional regulator [Dethiosulfatibacter aminovorans]SHJ85251.1 PAS domain S-box-containing protein [Dethiosulfatibacter aminovorans DSM 17477]
MRLDTIVPKNLICLSDIREYEKEVYQDKADFVIEKKKDSDEFEKFKNVLKYYTLIFDFFEEEILVSDNTGKILFINQKSADVMGIDPEDYIGENINDLVDRKIFNPSATLNVLKERKRVDLLIRLKSGEQRLASAVPIFDQDGEMELIICTSKNVLEIVKLEEKLERRNKKISEQSEQINQLQREIMAQNNFISVSGEMKDVVNKVNKLAHFDVTLLVTGETGVGKGVLARTIHQISDRRNKPFIKVNCGLIPENLLDSELFGYEGGAFTGADAKGKVGKFELADGGTLFLDEIGEMPMSLQVKLLDFIQDKEFTRVGGTKKQVVDTRIVAATNRDLIKMVEKGSFRKDLLFRLNTVNIEIPPLRNRVEDIPELVEHFINKFNTKYMMKKRIMAETVQELLVYDWPGNIRELEHVIERMMLMSDGNYLTSEDFRINAASRTKGHAEAGRVFCTGIMPYKEAKRELERQLILKAYEKYRSTYKAAESLGINQSTVSKLLKKYSE